MLLLTRKNQQSISIGDHIVIKVLEISGGRIRVGIEAPQSVSVSRGTSFEAPADTSPLPQGPSD